MTDARTDLEPLAIQARAWIERRVRWERRLAALEEGWYSAPLGRRVLVVGPVRPGVGDRRSA